MIILHFDVITLVFPITLDSVVSDEFITTEGHSRSADSSCVQCEKSEKGDHSAPLLGESVSLMCKVRLLACTDTFPSYAIGEDGEKPVVTFPVNWWVNSSHEKEEIQI